jgi:hypothetical protein
MAFHRELAALDKQFGYETDGLGWGRATPVARSSSIRRKTRD